RPRRRAHGRDPGVGRDRRHDPLDQRPGLSAGTSAARLADLARRAIVGTHHSRTHVTPSRRGQTSKEDAMKTEICDRLGIEFPIFAFSHCRDVVAAVSNAGGFGVLGAVGFSAEQLEVECAWLDEHVTGGYGVDIVIPGKYVGMGEMDVEKLQVMLAAQIPAEHRDFAKRLLSEHGVPELPSEEKPRELLGWTEATAGLQVEVALEHPKVRAFANALGTPPASVIQEIQVDGRLVGALCGSAKQALSHKEAGLDFIIAQGTEGGGHTGEIGSIV